MTFYNTASHEKIWLWFDYFSFCLWYVILLTLMWKWNHIILWHVQPRQGNFISWNSFQTYPGMIKNESRCVEIDTSNMETHILGAFDGAKHLWKTCQKSQIALWTNFMWGGVYHGTLCHFSVLFDNVDYCTYSLRPNKKYCKFSIPRITHFRLFLSWSGENKNFHIAAYCWKFKLSCNSWLHSFLNLLPVFLLLSGSAVLPTLQQIRARTNFMTDFSLYLLCMMLHLIKYVFPPMHKSINQKTASSLKRDSKSIHNKALCESNGPHETR